MSGTKLLEVGSLSTDTELVPTTTVTDLMLENCDFSTVSYNNGIISFGLPPDFVRVSELGISIPRVRESPIIRCS